MVLKKKYVVQDHSMIFGGFLVCLKYIFLSNTHDNRRATPNVLTTVISLKRPLILNMTFPGTGGIGRPVSSHETFVARKCENQQRQY